MDTRQIFNLIKNEQPQTVAFILSYLESKQVSQIVPLFSPQDREEIVERLGSMDSISSELIGKVLKSLGKHLASGTQKYSLHRRGGAEAAAQLLNSLDKELSKTLLSRIEEKNAELGGAIRKKLFRFEDIARLSQSDVQRLLRDVETQDLAMALKNATEPVKGPSPMRCQNGLRLHSKKKSSSLPPLARRMSKKHKTASLPKSCNSLRVMKSIYLLTNSDILHQTN